MKEGSFIACKNTSELIAKATEFAIRIDRLRELTDKIKKEKIIITNGNPNTLSELKTTCLTEYFYLINCVQIMKENHDLEDRCTASVRTQ